MSNHYVAINRGIDGFKISDFTLGTSSSASSDIELRIADTDANGKTPTRMDIQKALRAFERELASGAILSNFPPL
jgi:hypothetical protein